MFTEKTPSGCSPSPQLSQRTILFGASLASPLQTQQLVSPWPGAGKETSTHNSTPLVQDDIYDLCAGKSPHVLHPIPWKFPQHCLWFWKFPRLSNWWRPFLILSSKIVKCFLFLHLSPPGSQWWDVLCFHCMYIKTATGITLINLAEGTLSHQRLCTFVCQQGPVQASFTCNACLLLSTMNEWITPEITQDQLRTTLSYNLV